MPLLEIAQPRRYLTAMVRVEESTAQRIDQYAAFMSTSADEVVDKALAYVFARDKEFQEYLQRPEALRVPQSLRVRHPGQNGSVPEPVNGVGKPANGASAAHDSMAGKRSIGVE